MEKIIILLFLFTDFSFAYETITHVTEFLPNKGTWIYEGLAAPQKADFSDEVRDGLGYQGLIDVTDLTEDTIVKTTPLPEGFFHVEN
ncbi:hypothetical protein [Vibrio spartinae]|uniref:Uncharacterized protein n=1 Tax=Vibrio spartinae TaxID=1918945 RepID=A0A1N6LZB1_9VIBR|nr:hypothetical protein [Vibrio spartinae]SIO92518.1 hypothetical protein VSP9026_00130 [Vibrio spartinae]